MKNILLKTFFIFTIISITNIYANNSLDFYYENIKNKKIDYKNLIFEKQILENNNQKPKYNTIDNAEDSFKKIEVRRTRKDKGSKRKTSYCTKKRRKFGC